MKKLLNVIKKVIKVGLIGLGLLMCLGMICSLGQDSANENNEIKETTEVVKTAEEPKEEVSVEYKNALKKAKIYSDSMHMSKDGIYEQLVSEYGEGFSEEAAQYAVDNLKADYNKNALEKAKIYRNDMAMSKSNVYEQLVSPYGEGFTEEQAQYAIDNIE